MPAGSRTNCRFGTRYEKDFAVVEPIAAFTAATTAGVVPEVNRTRSWPETNASPGGRLAPGWRETLEATEDPPALSPMASTVSGTSAVAVSQRGRVPRVGLKE